MRRFHLIFLLSLLPVFVLGQSAVTVRGPAGANGSDGADAPTSIFVSAYLSANEAHAAGATTMVFDTEAADAAGVYNNTTGVMTVATDVLYLVSSCIHDWTGSGEQMSAAIVYEGSVLHRGMLHTNPGSDSVCVTAVVSAVATDTISIRLDNFSGGMTVRGGQDRTWLTIAGPL